MTEDTWQTTFPPGDQPTRIDTRRFAAYLYSRGLARSTVETYTKAVMAADRWCRAEGWTLGAVPGPVVTRFADQLPATFWTRKLYRSALGHYWAATGRRRPPLGGIPMPRKPRGSCRALSERDAAALDRTALAWDGPEGLAVGFGLRMGLRRFEIAKIAKADFDQDRRRLTVLGKGGSVDDLPVPSRLDPQIAVQWDAGRGPWLFPGQWPGRPVAPFTINTWVGRVAAVAGVRCTPHQLRHTCLATLNDQHGDLRAAMTYARHRDPAVTLIYTRTTWARLVELGEGLDYS